MFTKSNFLKINFEAFVLYCGFGVSFFGVKVFLKELGRNILGLVTVGRQQKEQNNSKIDFLIFIYSFNVRVIE